MGDSCRQVSWLAAPARRSRLPALNGRGQWHLGRRSPLTVAGAAAAWRGNLSHRVPFSPAATPEGPRQRPSRAHSEASHAHACQQIGHSGHRFCFCVAETATHAAL